MKDDIRYRCLSVSTPIQDRNDLVELANPLTAVALNLEACLRFLDRDFPSVDDATRQLREAILQCSRAQEIYHRARGEAAVTLA